MLNGLLYMCLRRPTLILKFEGQYDLDMTSVYDPCTCMLIITNILRQETVFKIAYRSILEATSELQATIQNSVLNTPERAR